MGYFMRPTMNRRRAWSLAGAAVCIAVAAAFCNFHETGQPPIRIGMTADAVSAALRQEMWNEDWGCIPLEYETDYWKERDDWLGHRCEYIFIPFSADGRVESWKPYQSPWERPAWMRDLLKRIGL
jgi:hypothetical protein